MKLCHNTTAEVACSGRSCGTYCHYIATQGTQGTSTLSRVSFLGLQLFHGKFWSCNDTAVPDKEACIGTFLLDGKVCRMGWS